MADQSQQPKPSYIKRVGNSFKNMFIGILVILLSIFILYKNEGSSVKRQKSLDEIAKEVVEADPSVIDPNLNGKVVHMSAKVINKGTVYDDLLKIKTDDLKLKRTVQMLQWEEEEEEDSEGDTQISYKKVWSEDLIDSSGFSNSSYQNPKSMPFKSALFTGNLYIGAHRLSSDLINKISDFKPLDITDSKDTIASISASLNKKFSMNKDTVIIAQNPQNPEIGAIKITVSHIPSQIVSLIATQYEDTFEPVQTKVGERLSILRMGSHSADGLIDIEKSNNNTKTWILRIIGLVIMFFGFMLIFGPLTTLTEVIPIIGSIVNLGASLFAFVLTSIIGGFIIGFSWFIHRPVITLGLAIIIGAILYAIKNKQKLLKK